MWVILWNNDVDGVVHAKPNSCTAQFQPISVFYRMTHAWVRCGLCVDWVQFATGLILMRVYNSHLYKCLLNMRRLKKVVGEPIVCAKVIALQNVYLKTAAHVTKGSIPYSILINPKIIIHHLMRLHLWTLSPIPT